HPATERRPIGHNISTLGHLLAVVRDDSTYIITAHCQLADSDLRVAHVEQQQGLHVVDVVDSQCVEFEFDDIEKLPVKPLDQQDNLKIVVTHVRSVSSQPYNDRSCCLRLRDSPRHSQSLEQTA